MVHTHTAKLLTLSFALVFLFTLGIVVPRAEASFPPPPPARLFLQDFHSSSFPPPTTAGMFGRGNEHDGQRGMFSSSTTMGERGGFSEHGRFSSSTMTQRGGMFGSTGSSTRGSTVDLTCAQTAVQARGVALLASWQSFTGTITNALTTRESALATAWGMTDMSSRNAALSSALKAWADADRTARESLKRDRKSAWDQFASTMKNSCRVTVPKDEALKSDSTGSIAL